jgi:hypothetical protein
MHDDKDVPLGILMTDAFRRPIADGIHYVNIRSSMAYGHTVGVLCLSVHLCGEKFLIQANLNT